MMPQDYNPSTALYDPRDCGKPMIDAVADLAAKTGREPKSFHGTTLTEIYTLAEETYDDLPDFWKVWHEWHAPQPEPKMGDL